MGVDRRVIYSLTETSELPLSLQEASAIGDVNEVRSLLAEGVQVDGWDQYGAMKKTALQRASINGHKGVVELLIDKGADVNYHDDWPGGTALHYAAEYRRTEIVELLIAKGANLKARRGYPSGDTPLHTAVRKGHKDIAELLIKKGADVNARNGEGKSPLDVVGSRNLRQISELLVANGAKGEMPNLTEEPPQTMRERFQSMSPEERKKFREQMRKRFEARKEQEKKE
jgi:ankyrin repeat protein